MPVVQGDTRVHKAMATWVREGPTRVRPCQTSVLPSTNGVSGVGGVRGSSMVSAVVAAALHT